MMKWYKPLYMGEKAEEDRYRILTSIRRGRPRPGIYVITPASGGNNILDIYPASELLLPYYRKRELTALGVAAGYQEALEVARRIVDDLYRTTGGLDLNAFLEGKASCSLS